MSSPPSPHTVPLSPHDLRFLLKPKKYYKPVVALAGSVTKEAGNGNTCGIDAFFPIVRECITLEKAMEKKTAKENLALTAEQVIRLWKAAQRDEVLS